MTKHAAKLNYFLVTGLVIVVCTIGATIVHGHLTNRWGRADVALRAAARALTGVPDRFGSWVKIADHEFPSNVPGILDFAGAINRTYLNSETGQSVSVAMIVGPPGPTSTHVAEMCYTAKGWTLVGQPGDLTIPAAETAEHHFRHTLFESPSVEKQRQEVCYAWRAGELWEVPRVAPRVAFGNEKRLFKIQVAASYELGQPDEALSVCREFLSAFLPALDSSVFAALVE